MTKPLPPKGHDRLDGPQRNRRTLASGSPSTSAGDDLASLVGLVESYVADSLMPGRSVGRGADVVASHAPALAQLSAAFTSERDALPPGYLTQPRFRAAYLLYFLPVGVATVASVLRRSGGVPLVPDDRPLRILDLGAGPLTAAMAAILEHRGGGPIEVVAVDGVAQVLADGCQILSRLGKDARVKTITANLRDRRQWVREVRGQFDLVLASNVLNEWQQGGRKSVSAGTFVRDLVMNFLAPTGRAVFVEPATRRASHLLIEARAEAIASDLAVLSPCMGAGPCPLASPSMRDWCHSETPWQRPALIARLDAAIGHRRDVLKSSHLVVAHGPQPAAVHSRWRVIGGPMRSGGWFRRYLCGADGRFVALSREGRVPPVLFLARRGDAIELPGRPGVAQKGRVEERTWLPAETWIASRQPSEPSRLEDKEGASRAKHPVRPKAAPRPRRHSSRKSDPF